MTILPEGPMLLCQHVYIFVEVGLFSYEMIVPKENQAFPRWPLGRQHFAPPPQPQVSHFLVSFHPEILLFAFLQIVALPVSWIGF